MTQVSSIISGCGLFVFITFKVIKLLFRREGMLPFKLLFIRIFRFFLSCFPAIPSCFVFANVGFFLSPFRGPAGMQVLFQNAPGFPSKSLIFIGMKLLEIEFGRVLNKSSCMQR